MKAGDPGGFPPQACAISNVLRPHTPAPSLLNASFINSALCFETLSGGTPSDIKTSVSPLKYQLNRPSPPSPRPFSGPSFGPATKPSSDMVILNVTFPMVMLLSKTASFRQRSHPVTSPPSH